MGIASVGKNADGIRRSARRFRVESASALRDVEPSKRELGDEVLSTVDVIVLRPFLQVNEVRLKTR